MYDAGLDLRLREGRRNRFGKALQPIHHGDENIAHPQVLKHGHDAQTEFGSFGLFDPDAEDFLGAIRLHVQYQINSLVLNAAFIA